MSLCPCVPVPVSLVARGSTLLSPLQGKLGVPGLPGYPGRQGPKVSAGEPLGCTRDPRCLVGPGLSLVLCLLRAPLASRVPWGWKERKARG